MDIGEWKMCATCRWPLMKAHVGATFTWEHMANNPTPPHAVVPVTADGSALTRRCDFCDETKVVDMVLAGDFMLPGETDRSAGAWAACATCGRLVRGGRWSALVTRVRWAIPGAAVMPRRHLVDLYARLNLHMTGVQTVDEWLAANFGPDMSEPVP